MSISLLIADDHGIMRELLSEHLAHLGFNVLAGASDGLQAIVRARKFKPDIILMDLYMPNVSGFEAIEVIKKGLPQIKIIVLTSYFDRKIYSDIKPYINGYLRKEDTIDIVEDAIIRVYEGEDYFFGIDADYPEEPNKLKKQY